MTTSEEFWKLLTVDEFKKLTEDSPNKQRLSYDIQKIIPHVRHSKVVMDLACGTGKHINLLNDIIGFEKCYIADINEKILFNTAINSPLNVEQCVPYDLNLTTPPETALVDTIMMLGIVEYLHEQDRFEALLREFIKKTVILIIPCNEDGLLNTWYIIDTMQNIFKTVKYERLYPSNLEFGDAIHYLFVGKN